MGDALPQGLARVATPLRQLLIALLGLCLVSTAHAFKQGHARMLSAPGQPLEIVIPISNLSTEEQRSLNVALADSTLWTESGLTPPVPISQMQVSVKSRPGSDARVILVQSSTVSRQPVVDMLLTLSSASGTRQLQVSLLQPAFSKVELAQSGSVRVQQGDTLYSIAQRHMVPGASIHQMLWAIYQANPSAFINQNMNLVRAGAVLSIPDANAVLSIDPAYARARFVEHDARFRSGRSARSQSGAQLPVAGQQTQSSGRVTSAQAATTRSAPAQSRLQLSNEPVDTQSDQQAARKREIAENQARVGELTQNVQDMKQVLNQPPSDSSASVSGNPSDASSSSNALQTSVPRSNPDKVAAVDQDKKDDPVSVIDWLKDNPLPVLTLILALLAFLIGWNMRRNALRRDDDQDDADMGSPLSPEAKAAFEKKLNAIDLNLDEARKDANTPVNKGSNP